VRRVRPAITLFLLAPLVAEFLLGDLPINLLPALLILIGGIGIRRAWMRLGQR